MQDKLLELKEIIDKEICNLKQSKELEAFKVEYMGKKGKLTNVLKQLGSLSQDEIKKIGAIANEIKSEFEKKATAMQKEFLEKEIQEKIDSEQIDISITKDAGILYGTKHPMTKVMDDMKDIFIGMGYSVVDGPEVEFSKYNFDALNTAKDHPARDLQDTMYITEDILLRTQTSPVQIRAMLDQKPPIKVIVPGRVYRSDNVDATHSPMFHQFEGLVVDKNISMADLKGTLELFVKKYFGEDTKIKLRPHHFTFTEPSAEVDITCFVCNGEGCKVCKNEGFIEILGAGMVHPNVLRAGGIDPNEYQGFAFGMGLERIAMAKYNINDLRYIYENDIRFLDKF